MTQAIHPLDNAAPSNVVAWVRTIIDQESGKRIEGYAFTTHDMLTRPDWVEAEMRRYTRKVEYYLKTRRIE